MSSAQGTQMGSCSSPALLGTSFPPQRCETSSREPLGSLHWTETATFISHFWNCCVRVPSCECWGGCPSHQIPARGIAVLQRHRLPCMLLLAWHGSIIPVSEETTGHDGDEAEQFELFPSFSHPCIDQKSQLGSRLEWYLPPEHCSH